MFEETKNIIENNNKMLSDLCKLPYTDFYNPKHFIILFEMSVEEIGTLFDYCIDKNNFIFNRVFFINSLINVLRENKDKKIIKRIINKIKREFKGLELKSE